MITWDHVIIKIDYDYPMSDIHTLTSLYPYCDYPACNHPLSEITLIQTLLENILQEQEF